MPKVELPERFRNDSDDDGPEPPISFDFGTVPDFGEFNDGCNAVDFLFVIDNSGSMAGWPPRSSIAGRFRSPS